MENLTVKTTKSRDLHPPRSKKTRNIIFEEDIRRRAFEIYKENVGKHL